MTLHFYILVPQNIFLVLTYALHKNILIYNISFKTLVRNHCVLALIKLMGLLEFIMKIDI